MMKFTFCFKAMSQKELCNTSGNNTRIFDSKKIRIIMIILIQNNRDIQERGKKRKSFFSLFKNYQERETKSLKYELKTKVLKRNYANG